jgi:hypothetical protein
LHVDESGPQLNLEVGLPITGDHVHQHHLFAHRLLVVVARDHGLGLRDRGGDLAILDIYITSHLNVSIHVKSLGSELLLADAVVANAQFFAPRYGVEPLQQLLIIVIDLP